MRLITHNMLVCNVKACIDTASLDGKGAKNFPLRIEPDEDDGISKEETEFNPEFVAHMLDKLDWPALKLTAAELGVADLPDEVPESAKDDEEFLKSVHDLVIDLHIKNGALVCRHCERRYLVNDGIPNMLLHEDEL